MAWPWPAPAPFVRAAVRAGGSEVGGARQREVCARVPCGPHAVSRLLLPPDGTRGRAGPAPGGCPRPRVTLRLLLRACHL